MLVSAKIPQQSWKSHENLPGSPILGQIFLCNGCNQLQHVRNSFVVVVAHANNFESFLPWNIFELYKSLQDVLQKAKRLDMCYREPIIFLNLNIFQTICKLQFIPKPTSLKRQLTEGWHGLIYTLLYETEMIEVVNVVQL